MANNNVNSTKSLLNIIKHIICNGGLAFSIEKDKVKITYRGLSDIFSAIDEESRSLKDVIAPCLTLLCGWMFQILLVSHPVLIEVNLEKITKKSKNLDDIVLEFTHQTQNNDQ